MRAGFLPATVVSIATLASAGTAAPSAAGSADQAIVAGLDTSYQAAVKANDAATMGGILHADFVLVLGDGRTGSRADLLDGARTKRTTWEHQEEDTGTQTVRVWGDTAVVTARLWLMGRRDSVSFERRLWFSDTYVRTPAGWRYAFGQASLALPSER